MNIPTPNTPPKFLLTSTGPFSVSYVAHADAHSFDLEAGTLGACVDEADASIAYRCTNLVFHKTFTPVLEELSGEPRKIDEKATKARRRAAKPENKDKITPVMESFIVFANRAKAVVLKQDDGEDKWSEIEQRALELSKSIKIDASPQTREIRLVKGDLAKAQDWLALPDPDFVEEKIAKFSSFVGGFEVERDEENKPIDESLARLITSYMKKKREEELNSD